MPQFLGFLNVIPVIRRHAPQCNSLRSPPQVFSFAKTARSRRFKPTLAAAEPLVLSEENVTATLEEAKSKLGSIFGNSTENRNVGITGDVELVSIDGPIVVLRLIGRFWHKRADVLARVSTFLIDRIPEICDVEIEEVQQLEDTEEESTRLSA